MSLTRRVSSIFDPFVYALAPDPDNFDSYVEDTTQRFPVQMMVAGSTYSVLPGIESRLHLFGVEAPARISLLGTDGFGRDVLSRLLHGGRISIGAGLLATLCALLVGVAFGTIAGFFGGRVDAAVMRLADLFMAVPWLYLLFAVRAALPLHLDTRATFLLLVAVLWRRGVGATGAFDSRNRAERARAHVCHGRARLRCAGALSAATPHPAADTRRRAHAGGPARAAVHPRGGHALFPGSRRRRTNPQLGRDARQPSTVFGADVVLVDVHAGHRARRRLRSLTTRSHRRCTRVCVSRRAEEIA